ncbi:hypothetical protein EIN_091280, partial [Entamoeba invadens IP1]
MYKFDLVYYYHKQLKSIIKSGGKYISHMFFDNNKYVTCENNTRDCVNKTYAIQCSDGYFMNKAGNCIRTRFCKELFGGICAALGGTFDYQKHEFKKCDEKCLFCLRGVCSICASNSILINEKCQSKGYGEKIVYSHSVISCNDGYYNHQNSCHLCKRTFLSCELCDKKKCTKCISGYSLDTSLNCAISITISSTLKTTTQCPRGYTSSENGKCQASITHCLYFIENVCYQCESNYVLLHGKCYQGTITQSDNCEMFTPIGCLRCAKGYYIDKNNKCSKCNTKCTECTENSEKCQSCITGTVLSNGKCLTIFALEGVCNLYDANGQCAQCVDGYYISNSLCFKCTFPCAICKDDIKCDKCDKKYFVNENGICESVYNITNCGKFSETLGCLKCSDGYYKSGLRCIQCKQNCSLCTTAELCNKCSNNMVLSTGICKERLYINRCVNVTNSLCERCNFWYVKSDDTISCDKINMIKILLIVIFGCIILLILITIIMSFVGLYIIQTHHLNVERKKNGIFSIRCVREPIKQLIDKIYTNSSILDFGVDLPVNRMCIKTVVFANKSKYCVKLQLVYIHRKSYKITISPKVVTLRPRDACLFTIEISPTYSGDFKSSLTLSCVFLERGVELTKRIPLIFSTALSTWIDNSSITNMTEICRGGVGIIFKATYKGRTVAVKKIRQFKNVKDDEFITEVDMLQKIRNPFIVEFIGAVAQNGKHMIVMEYIINGSLDQIIKKYKVKCSHTDVLQCDDIILPLTIRYKILLDATKGVNYLHLNGIFHRDIKPGNILCKKREFV